MEKKLNPKKLQPIVADSLKDVFIKKFESMILSGEIKSGETLPSERDLAAQLKVSRPVVHEGLLELSVRGLVSMKPRSKAVVNDLRKEASVSMLESLINFHGDNLDADIQKNILDLRLLFEVENASLAAKNIRLKELREYEKCLATEEGILSDLAKYSDDEIVELDYRVHHLIAEASGNVIYPMLLNSFKPVYIRLSKKFFSDRSLIKEVHEFHKQLFEALKSKQQNAARKIMTQLLEHGSRELEKIIRAEKENIPGERK